MNNQKKPGKLNLDTKNVPPQSPEDAQKAIGEYYATVGNCALNMAIAMDKMVYLHEQMLVELTDIKDNMNKKGLSEGWLSELDIAEREAEEEDEPGKPENAE